MDLRPHQAVRGDQRGLPKLTGFRSRLERRAGAAEHYPAAFLDALAARLASLEPRGAAVLVGIDGWGCGGKTALAEGLLDRLEPGVQYLSTDEFFTGFEAQTDPGPAAHLRWPALTRTVRDLADTGGAEIAGYDWEGGAILPPEPIAGRAWLVEGLFSLHPDLRRWFDLSIWVQGRMADRMERVVRRDGAHMIPHWERDWLPREAAYMTAERPWTAADVIVAGAGLPVGEIGTELRRYS